MTKQLLTLSILICCFACGQHSSSATTKVKADTVALKADTLTQEQFEAASAKSDDYEENSLPSNARDFITEGYGLLGSARGDLNRDSLDDMVLVVYKKGEDSTDIDHPAKRPLLLLIGQADSTYKLATKSDNAVYCKNCGGMMGDPFMGITIKNGYFSVELAGGSGDRWSRIVTFKYVADESKWFLHKDGTESYQVPDPEKITRKTRTTKDFGKVAFEDFDVYKDN
ncbi:hypothetical protein [Pinibacter aurantiacus]|uniref:Uncharacterized protein n=1 Tax=Pinibacter aurantiacus TaxID=2851599 RepID=A0A9E2W367_9BACT|nr:hypothetical protein [Pinibacter aurantiacus]MBV4358185.1 hypothetical protein [Pinibacter aurantiacus]